MGCERSAGLADLQYLLEAERDLVAAATDKPEYWFGSGRREAHGLHHSSDNVRNAGIRREQRARPIESC